VHATPTASPRTDAVDTESDDRPVCAVLAPLLYLTVTIEQEGDGQQVHLHPGGQGFWIARMIEVLGLDARLVAPIGGEAGEVVAALLPGWGVGLTAVRAGIVTPTQVHDRRSGDREELVSIKPADLDRHAADDLYAAVLEAALTSDALVLTSGGDGLLPDEAYGRLVHDANAAGAPVFADMHGGALDACLEHGSLHVLKVSEDDLALDGRSMGSEAKAVAAARELGERGAATVVVSRGSEPAIAWVGGSVARVIPPELATVDHHGAGDSMTAGMTVGSRLGLSDLDVVRLGAAAGAANVTRRGLGSGRVELIAELAELVKLEQLD
jgi:1-phosphofructokinase